MPVKIHSPINKWLYVLVLCAGAMTVFAFAPFKFYPLAWFTPAVLFYALSKAHTRKQHLFLGWFYGIGLFGAGASWPFYSMYYFAHAPLFLALLGTALFVIIIAFLTLGLFGFLASLFRNRAIFLRVLLFYPALWVLVEWTRSWLFTGFPWLYLGNSQIDTIFAAFAPVTGVLGVSLSNVLIAGALVGFWFGNSLRHTVYIKPDPHNTMVSSTAVTEEPFGSSIRVLSALIILLLVVSSFTLSGVDWTDKTGKEITVSVLQSNISQREKLDKERTLNESIDLYKMMTRQSQKSDLIVWPETGLFDVFNNHMDSLILPLQQSIKRNNQSILIGGFNINADNQFENSVLALSKESRQVYSKRHLVPFGEYIPLLDYVRWLGRWIQLPYSNLVSGKSDGTLQVAGQTAQMSICYEDAFGAEIIEALPKATMLINLTHDGWFTGSLEPEQHMQIARMRSLETGRYMVRATTTGPSGIIDEKGNIIATAPTYTKKIITGRLQPFTGATPYTRWGDWLIVGVLSVILLIGFLVRRKENTIISRL